MPKTNTVMFSVTDFCNAKCRTCSFWKTEKPSYPRAEVLGRVVRRLRDELGCGFLQITGGEPLTYPYIYDLVREADKAGMITQLMTNGYLLDREKILRLEAEGLRFMAFSIDHFDDKIVYENRRLPGLLPKIRENVSILKGTRIISEGGITVSNYNIDDLERIAKFALEEIGVDETYFCLPMKLTGSTYKLGNPDYDVIDIPDSKMVGVLDRIIGLKKRHDHKIAHNLALLYDMRNYYLHKKQSLPCKAGENVFYLDNRLDLYTCMAKSIKLGNMEGSITTTKGSSCYDCPLMCFREASIYQYGMKSLPFILQKLPNRLYWRLAAK